MLLGCFFDGHGGWRPNCPAPVVYMKWLLLFPALQHCNTVSFIVRGGALHCAPAGGNATAPLCSPTAVLAYARATTPFLSISRRRCEPYSARAAVCKAAGGTIAQGMKCRRAAAK